MGERSALDRLAIAGVFMAGIAEAAQAALANAPAVTKAYPVLKLEGIWNYVPLFFICAATLLWFTDQALRLFRSSYAQARSARVPGQVEPSTPQRRFVIPWSIIGTVVVGAGAIALIIMTIFGISRCSDDLSRQAKVALASRPEMKLAPVLRGAVTLAFVRETLQSQNPVTAEKTLSPFLGTSMRISGIIHHVENGAAYSHLIRMTDEKATPQVYLLFAGSQSSAIQPYSEGEHIAAECKVERLDAAGIGLDGCVAIPDEAWTGKPEA